MIIIVVFNCYQLLLIVKNRYRVLQIGNSVCKEYLIEFLIVNRDVMVVFYGKVFGILVYMDFFIFILNDIGNLFVQMYM